MFIITLENINKKKIIPDFQLSKNLIEIKTFFLFEFLN